MAVDLFIREDYYTQCFVNTAVFVFDTSNFNLTNYVKHQICTKDQHQFVKLPRALMRSKREEAASKNGMKWHGGAITMRMRKETVLAAHSMAYLRKMRTHGRN
ncbi:hypothetical protein T11_14903 [Trichinella zimbabwensis]|uniref:Uncharacterized protein n=1 Tax=Trichinella zimbabwensis TaxID=268475 RepID=A0A0V1IA04_9BILA|nr:hypothetical protein T11_14903 [Trichinella zimbabwensis]